ncbi:molybdopterin-dependent oxidoreductase [Mesorhizobium sp. M0051]|uniref:molybdopterin-dependent oxidoreductase n=1 Tax=unclassified Mesorhizobium TaxID=325217 RepID=UPI0003FF04C4|nr:molybdopterin-dependent oxidoreductase [Mesorhizobium sp. LNHC252B00]
MSSLLNKRRLTIKRCLVILAVFVLGILPARALESIKLPEPPDTVAFNIQKNGESTPITLRQLEKLGLYRITTPSPFESGQLTFEGVLFSDVLKLIGLEGKDSVVLRAVDDYVQIIPREDWTDGPLLLATRQDGKLLTRRTQGPTRLVYPLNDYPSFDTPIRKPRWVWLIKAIESGN